MKAKDREEPRHDLGSVSRRFNSEAQVRARDRQCDVFGGQSDIGTDFSLSSLVLYKRKLSFIHI
jgi:hypothetical protein